MRLRFENDPAAFLASDSLTVGPASLLPLVIPKPGVAFSSALLISCPMIGWTLAGLPGALAGLILPVTFLMAERWGGDRHKLTITSNALEIHYGANILRCPWNAFDLERFHNNESEDELLELPIVASELNSIERHNRERMVGFGETCSSPAFKVDTQDSCIRVKLIFELNSRVCQNLVFQAAKIGQAQKH